MKKFLKFSILSLLFSFFSILTVNATDGYPAINASGTIESGKTFNVEFYANNVNGAGIMTVGGSVSSSNNTCIQFVSVAVPNNEGMAYNNKFAWQYATGKTGNVKTAIATFKAVGTNCSATVNISDIEFSFTDSTKLKKASISKNINVVTYSSNNNLAELAVDNGTLSPSFNAGTTNYTVTVGSEVTSVNIYARAADAKATVAGSGAKNINYGSNKFAITVKAENGNTKAYTVNVIRQDSRSSNANLKSLTLNNGNLSPSFNSSVTEYAVSVPYEVTKINVNAVADDANAKVAVSSPELVAEGTTNITVKVTAENGVSKTYIIKVTRGKDPNKILSKDNNLVSLEASVGMLSPVFNQNKTNYFVYLPYEVDDITFRYQVSDTKYAVAKINGPNKLKPDSANKYIVSVTAEDESVKDYVITVYRAKNPEDLDGILAIEEPNEKPRLKNIILSNGKLINQFDPDTNTYQYTKKDAFSYDYELEDENTYINVFEQGDNIYFVLESETGDMNVYCLHLKGKSNNNSIIYIIIIIILLLFIALLIFKMLVSDKKNSNNSEKNHKDKNNKSVKKESKKQ